MDWDTIIGTLAYIFTNAALFGFHYGVARSITNYTLDKIAISKLPEVLTLWYFKKQVCYLFIGTTVLHWFMYEQALDNKTLLDPLPVKERFIGYLIANIIFILIGAKSTITSYNSQV